MTILKFIKEYKFQKIGTFKLSGTANNKHFEFEDKKYKPDKDIVYLWVANKELIYVGQTSGTFKNRGHHIYFRNKVALLNLYAKLNNGDFNTMLEESKEEVKRKYFKALEFMAHYDIGVYIKKPSTIEILGDENISLRHAEEMAIIRKFKPQCNKSKKGVTWV